MDLLSIIVGATITLAFAFGKDIIKGLFTRNVDELDTKIQDINKRLDGHDDQLSSLKVSQAVQGEAQKHIKEAVDHIKDTVDTILKELK